MAVDPRLSTALMALFTTIGDATKNDKPDPNLSRMMSLAMETYEKYFDEKEKIYTFALFIGILTGILAKMLQENKPEVDNLFSQPTNGMVN